MKVMAHRWSYVSAMKNASSKSAAQQAAIKSARGILKPADPRPLSEQWAEHKHEEQEIEDRKAERLLPSQPNVKKQD